MKIKILTYIIITYALASLFPWWIIACVGTFIGFISRSNKEAILSASISLIFVWLLKLGINFFILDYLIIDKIKIFLNLSSFQLIFISLTIPLIISIFSSLFGYQLKKVISNEK